MLMLISSTGRSPDDIFENTNTILAALSGSSNSSPKGFPGTSSVKLDIMELVFEPVRLNSTNI